MEGVKVQQPVVSKNVAVMIGSAEILLLLVGIFLLVIVPAVRELIGPGNETQFLGDYRFYEFIVLREPDKVFISLAAMVGYAVARTATGGGPLLLRLWFERSQIRAKRREYHSDDGAIQDDFGVYVPRDALEPLSVLRACVARSARILGNMRGWATANLIAGIFVGFAGVGLFLFQAAPDIPLKGFEKGDDWLLLAASFARTIPRVVVLAFVEIIAVFFLRQYRISMNEYRAMEGVLRMRETEFFAAIVRSREQVSSPLSELADRMFVLERLPVLEAGQSTELLQLLKITNENNEVVDVFGQLAALFQGVVTGVKNLGANRTGEPGSANTAR